MTNPFGDGFKVVKVPDAIFAARQNENEVKIASFKDQKSKYISIVSDSEHVLEENSRYKYLATYIQAKDQVTGIKIQKFKKSGGELIEDSVISVPLKQSQSLEQFLKFLVDADLGTLASGKFVLTSKLELDRDIYSKLVSLSADLKGKEALIKLFDSGYLTGDFDVWDLIKRGLSQSKIEAKFKQIDEFEKLIKTAGIKEVSDVQSALSKMPWIFGPEYLTLDVRKAGEAGVPDKRLKRIDGLSDILEIKLPNVELLRQDGMGRQYISPHLAEALGQLTGYLEYYYSEYTTERNDDTSDEILEDRMERYYKPKGILLIGRRQTTQGVGVKNTTDAQPKRLRRLLSYFHWVDVLTYDDLIDRARNGLKNLAEK